MKDAFCFKVQTEAYFGVGYSRNINELLDRHGYKNVALLVDEGVAKYSKYYTEIEKLLRDSVQSLHIEVLRGTEEPDYDYLDDVAERIRG